uniref:Uncharacterized protein n=1 Tax=Glossina morsitans morsitans TaxID=37546 RepID=A0A1B0G4A5_GLOMM
MLTLKREFLVLTLMQLIRFNQTALFYPSNSAYGLFAAIAVPLDLPHRNVFVSYNFEANYNLPQNWRLPPYATNLADEDLFDDNARHLSDDKCGNCTGNHEERIFNKNVTRTRKERSIVPSLLTRTHFYQILIDKFTSFGFEGETCLLRLICETNSSELGNVNGILGNVMHVIFSPSTSQDENLPTKYHQAEIDGIDDQCERYAELCQENILDFVSIPMHEIIENVLKEK